MIESEEELSDFGVQWNGTALTLYSSEPLPSSGVQIAARNGATEVLYNGKEISFTVEDGMVQTGKVLENPGSGSTSSGGGSGSSSNVVSGSSGGNGNGNATAGSGGTNSSTLPGTETNTTTQIPEFSDVAGHWAQEQIEHMARQGVINGMDDGTFQPDSSVTRAQFATMLVKALELPTGEGNGSFTDVSESEWYAPYAVAARRAGIVNGYEDGSFQPEREISRQEMAILLRAVCAKQGLYEDLTDIRIFSDWEQIALWAAESVQAVVGFGLMQGMDDGTFSPECGATRAQAAVVLCRLLDLLEREV